jgi:hypothetical protein
MTQMEQFPSNGDHEQIGRKGGESGHCGIRKGRRNSISNRSTALMVDQRLLQVQQSVVYSCGTLGSEERRPSFIDEVASG